MPEYLTQDLVILYIAQDLILCYNMTILGEGVAMFPAPDTCGGYNMAINKTAYKNEWISKEQLLGEAEKYKKTEYGKYLKRVAEQDFKQYKEIFESDLFNAN